MNSSATTHTTVDLPLRKIIPDPGQPRQDFGNLTDLRDSIREHGVIQPIIVCRDVDRYRIVCGARRFKAAKQAGLKTIPAVIREVSNERDLRAIQLIENIQRKELNPLEEANAL